MSRLSRERIVDPVLTRLAQGFSQANLIAAEIFPNVKVDKEGFYIPLLTKEHFRIHNTERGLHARSNRYIHESPDKLPVTLVEHDWTEVLDYREIAESEFDARQGATFRVTEIIKLSRENRIATLVQAHANYPSGSKGTPTNKWSNTATSDPLVDIETAREAIRSKVGAYPTHIAFGPTAWKSFREHPDVVERFKYTSAAQVGVAEVERLLGLTVLIGGAIKLDDSTGNFVDVWGDNVVLWWKNPNPAAQSAIQQSPNFGLNCVREQAYALGPVMDTWTEENGKIELIRGTTNEAPVFHGAVAGYIIYDVNA